MSAPLNKVYVVLECDYEGENFKGIFTTLPKARKLWETLNKEFRQIVFGDINTPYSLYAKNPQWKVIPEAVILKEDSYVAGKYKKT